MSFRHKTTKTVIPHRACIQAIKNEYSPRNHFSSLASTILNLLKVLISVDKSLATLLLLPFIVLIFSTYMQPIGCSIRVATECRLKTIK